MNSTSKASKAYKMILKRAELNDREIARRISASSSYVSMVRCAAGMRMLVWRGYDGRHYARLEENGREIAFSIGDNGWPRGDLTQTERIAISIHLQKHERNLSA